VAASVNASLFPAGLPLPAAPKQVPATPAAQDRAAATETPSVPLRLLFAVLLGEFTDREETAKPARDAAPNKNGTPAETGEQVKHSPPFSNKSAATGADTAPLTLPTPAPVPIPAVPEPVPATPMLVEQPVAEPTQDLPVNALPKQEGAKEESRPSIAVSRLPVWTAMRATSIGRAVPPANQSTTVESKRTIAAATPRVPVARASSLEPVSTAPKVAVTEAIQTGFAPEPVASPEPKSAPVSPTASPVVPEIPPPTPEIEKAQIATTAPAKPAASPTPPAIRPSAAQKISVTTPTQPRRSQSLNQPVGAMPASHSTDPVPTPSPTGEIPQDASPLPPEAQPAPPQPLSPQATALPTAPVAAEKPIERPENAPATDVAPAVALEPAPLPKPAPARRKEERTHHATFPATAAPNSAAAMIAPLLPPVEPDSMPEPATRSPAQSPARAEKNSAPTPEPQVKRIVWPVVAMEGRNRAPLATAPIHENTAAPDDLAVRVVAPGVRETGELAFTASLTPLLSDSPHSDAQDVPATPAQRPALEHRLPAEHSEPAPASAPTESKPAAPSSSTSHSAPRPAPVRTHSEEPTNPIVRQTASATTIQMTANAPAQSRESAPAKPAEAPEPNVRTTLETEPQVAKQTGPAREIRLEMGSADARVEVKLSERAGELKVAVRTPDSHLAERLRADLPALSSRLEDSGLRAETWRPSAVAASEARNTHEVSTANTGGHPQDAESHQQGREQQRHGEPRQPRFVEKNEQPKEKGKDFEWFLSATQ
jgi:hypothetical protein